MAAVTLDAYTYKEVETFAHMNNIDVAEVVKTSVLNFIRKFNTNKAVTAVKDPYLPEHIEKLAGCLAGIEEEKSDKDERFNYLMEKYK